MTQTLLRPSLLTDTTVLRAAAEAARAGVENLARTLSIEWARAFILGGA